MRKKKDDEEAQQRLCAPCSTPTHLLFHSSFFHSHGIRVGKTLTAPRAAKKKGTEELSILHSPFDIE